MDLDDAAGEMSDTWLSAGSKDWGLLQLYPALHAEHGPFLLSGPSPSFLHSVP